MARHQQAAVVGRRLYEGVSDLMSVQDQPRLSPPLPFPCIGTYSRLCHSGQWPPAVDICLPWLESSGLTRTVDSFQPAIDADSLTLMEQGRRIAQGVPVQRVPRLPKSEVDARQTAYRERRNGPNPLSQPKVQQHIWEEYKDPEEAVMSIDLRRVPAEALAFYRPFHFAPYNEWGIYLLADRLLPQCGVLYRCMEGKIYLFDAETLLASVLFEVFHHEFFHHLTECAATIMEIISAGFGEPRRLYLDYWDHRYREEYQEHPDAPLEEALANAYAYNSFSFVARVKAGHKPALVKVYQAVLRKAWRSEPPGYRSAGRYIELPHAVGAADLLAMLLPSGTLDPASLLLLADKVMPMGHAAFEQKANIPTYLVGSEDSLNKVNELVPALNETYVKLYWPGDTSKLDAYLQQRKKEEREAKKAKAQKKA